MNITLTTANQHGAVWELDGRFVGTEDYMGVAYFWDQRLKHVLRAASPSARVKVHAAFLAAGVPFDAAERCFYTTEAAVRIVEEHF